MGDILAKVALSKFNKIIRRNDFPTFVIFGDSITAQNGAIDSLGMPVQYWQPAGYFKFVNMFANGKIRLLKNAGIGGNTTGLMLARISTDVLLYKSDFVVVYAGINDVTTGVSSETTIANLTAIYNAIKGNGSKLVIATIGPAAGVNTAGELAILNAINQFIRTYAYANKDVVLVDWYQCLNDTDAQYIKSTYSTDGTHPIGQGAYRMGKMMYNAINKVCQFSDETYLAKTIDDANNLIGNGVLTGDVSGLATGWALAGSPTTKSKNFYEGDLISYNEQIFTCTSPITFSMYRDISTGFTPGQTIQGFARLKLSNMVTSGEISFKIFYNAGAGLTGLAYSLTGAMVPYTLYPSEYIDSTPEIIIPANTTALRVYISFTAFHGDVNISNPTIRVVT